MSGDVTCGTAGTHERGDDKPIDNGPCAALRRARDFEGNEVHDAQLAFGGGRRVCFDGL